MEIFATLENKVEQLIAAFHEMQERLAAVEEENERLRALTSDDDLRQRIDQLEGERSALRERLEKLVEKISDIEP